jgi:hypothetical protein
LQLLANYEEQSEFIGMMDFVRELKTCPSLCGSSPVEGETITTDSGDPHPQTD